jgi:hypothetical protein
LPRYKTGSRTINSSFCFSLNDIDTITVIEEMAVKAGLSFSQYLVKVCKEHVERQKVIDQPEPNSIGVQYNNTEEFDNQPILSEEETLKQELASIEGCVNKLPELYPKMNMDQLARMEAATKRGNVQINDILRKKRRDNILNKTTIAPAPQPEPTTAAETNINTAPSLNTTTMWQDDSSPIEEEEVIS